MLLVNSGFYINRDTGGEFKLHQRFNRIRVWINNIDQALMCSNLKLFSRLLVDMRRS